MTDLLAEIITKVKNDGYKTEKDIYKILSVIIQVTYFKKTGGKRLFKMSPIHHHFELCGWSETRVTAVFSIVTTIMCLLAYLAL